MRYKFILFLLFFHFALSFAQNSKEISSIDSLWTIVSDKNAYAEKGSKEMLRLCTEMYYQSKDIGYDKGQLNSIVKLAGIYLDERNYSEALKKIPEGIELAEKSNSYLNWSNLLIIQGDINTELGYFQKARKSFKKALLITDKVLANDKKYASKSAIYYQIGNISDSEGVGVGAVKNDSALFYFHKAYEESKKISSIYPMRKIYIAKYAAILGAEYLDQNNIPQAERYLDEFPLLMKDEKNKASFIPYYRIRGQIEIEKKNYPKAIEYFNQSIALFKEYKLLPSELAASYSGISKAYQGSGDYKNEAFYLAESSRIKDSLLLADKKTVEKVPSEPKKKEQPVNNIFIIIVFTVFVTILVCWLFFFQKKKTGEKEAATVELKEEKLIPNEFDTLHSLEQHDNTELQDLSTIIERVKNNDKSFHLKFLELYPKFNQHLLVINPQLTHLDLEYCALIKLNFDTKEIARFKNTSVNSVESRKYRIRKKLGIATHENMYVWFMNL
ncbi:tetratricopeptide repeat protein [Chryseobacterium sp. SIMBA_029]|uniref:tetratricopeptide repeat protein n=1 Tax=Chryseobacterium sp. SIMBA_029 TaxID=3085772 RepID=UPI00397B1D73